MAASTLPPLAVGDLLAGKRLLFTGATGFLGKVSLSMLLHRYGDRLEKVYVLVRKGSAASAEARFFEKVVTSEPFEPLREQHGENAMAFFKSKCVVLDGDVTDPWVGLEEAQGKALKGQLDAVINCAGLVSFNPSLEVGLNVNTRGLQLLVDACLHWDVPLVHVSTAFVAGNRSGLIFEDEPVVGYFPRKGELDGKDFSLEQELKDADAIVARWRQMADDKALASTFRQAALERLEEEGRDASDEKTLRLAMARERKFWLGQKLTEAGMERAKHWGWPNTYTYTKSLGEQVIASTPGLRYAIVRPSVVESALRYPFPGWNEGFTTSAPVCYAALRGHRSVPAGDKAVLDMIPVDMVAGSLIAITAQQFRTSERRVYQQASGDSNPFYASRSVELVGLYRRRHYREKETGNRFLNELLSKLEPRPVSKQEFFLRSAPLFAQGSRWLKKTIDEVKPQWGMPNVSAWLTKQQEKLDGVASQADTINMIVSLFLPFIWENRFLFRCDNTRSLYEDMPERDKVRIPWDPAAIDWRRYFLEVHMPGLEKWVFPGLDEESEKRRTVSAYRDLLELFDATVHAYRHRVAFRFVEDGRSSRFTYGEVAKYAARVGSFLLKSGVAQGDRVLLVSENRMEWPVSYFGILRSGATAVPVDPELSELEVVNIARRAEAKVVLISEQTAESMPTLHQALVDAGAKAQVVSLAQALSGDETQPDGIGKVKRSANGDDVASLIFTSGTTGTPKGVMLTHRNFTSLVAKLASAFEVGLGDGVLSVLPLHHTFEFTAGFLTPFMRGAEVTYLDELSADTLSHTLETGNINGMIGVPALWQLFHRKVTQDLASRPRFVEEAVRGLMALNAELRERTDVNLGKLFFWPIHKKLGGLEHIVSGGSALPDDVHKTFHALGFDLAEGYGLTESSPVLTLNVAGNQRLKGSVGKALPGIEVKIHEPDEHGVGEVIAKGPNVMAGYFQDREATDATLKDGWLFTGDLGRLDADGNLFLSGRRKEIIIDANGKNVYPDELEELYGVHPHLKELSVVGLPDEAGAEKVACLAVPDYKDRPPAEVRKELEAHFKDISQAQPFSRRIKVLRLWDGELPRTASRKVKRKAVVEELKRLEKVAASAEKGRTAAKETGNDDWLLQVVADVLQRPVADIRPEARLTGELGFDSLMLTELQTALEHAGVATGGLGDLAQVSTVAELRRAVAQAGRRPSDVGAKVLKGDAKSTELELPIPEVVAKAGRSLLSAGQRALYGGVFTVKTQGEAFIPKNRNVLVVANHASHLDMGLVKVVMGEQGERLTALAARDYFFDSPVKRAYFENFTNLIPMDRSGSLRESLRMAVEALNQGYHLLIFPEGTRSPTGVMTDFKPTLGFLALTAEVDVLPMYLDGTHDAFPKGALWPKSRELEVRIGPAITLTEMRRRTQGLARSESYRLITRLAEEAVTTLRDGRSYAPESLGRGANVRETSPKARGTE